MFRTVTIVALCINVEHIGRILLSDPDSLVFNYGMAFSVLQDMPVLTTVLSGIACLLIGAVFVFAKLNRAERIGYSVMLGGAVSNFAEKLILGYVIDWIPLPFVPLTINIADIEVSLGALIAFLNFTV
ncbi:MAG: signal peptidase II [Synergistaceae bacterium]|nr:signal peptidase II [Synergistaceae bacterium]MBQ9573649.1 signal peptidase II [Synergistaceae bacterium]